VGQAVGLILSKRGLEGGFPVISGVAIRMIVAMLTLWIATLVMGKARETVLATRDRRALGMIVIGSILGPFLGVWLSLVSVQLSPVGVASTLQALNPIFLLPIGRWVFHEKISARSFVGTLISLSGVGALFLL
jgi:drug/metabolite transporter (DMT)-like permease